MVKEAVASAAVPVEIEPGTWMLGEFIGLRKITVPAYTDPASGEVRAAFDKYLVVLDMGQGHGAEISYRNESDARKAVSGVVVGQLCWIGAYATASKSGRVYWNGTLGVEKSGWLAL